MNTKDKDKSLPPIEEDLAEVTIELNDEKEPFISNQRENTEESLQKMEKISEIKIENAKTHQRNAILAVIFYWITSLSLVFVNKIVMVGDLTHLDAPLFMSWTQFLITVICCWLLGILGRYVEQFAFFPPFEYKLSIAKKVMPLTFVFLAMIIFNNLCLKYVEVSFYQVARALTMVFNMIFTYLLLGKKTTRNCIICCIIIVVGYIMGCDGEIRFSWIGAIFGLLSSAFVALNAIYVKKVSSVVEDNSEKLMIYNNINAVLLLPVFIFAANEHTEIQTHFGVFFDSFFWSITIIAGVMGFLINYATYLQIKFTSPLSHNVSGTAKAAAQTILALLIFRNPVSIQGLTGCAIVIIASSIYTQLK